MIRQKKANKPQANLSIHTIMDMVEIVVDFGMFVKLTLFYIKNSKYSFV
jgi:hypothetical protein